MDDQKRANAETSMRISCGVASGLNVISMSLLGREEMRMFVLMITHAQRIGNAPESNE